MLHNKWNALCGGCRRGSFLFETQSVVPDRAGIFFQLGGNIEKLHTARHSIKLFRTKVMPLPKDMRPVRSSARLLD